MEEWEIAKTLSLKELYHYKGQVIPWPPSDEDILWWGQKVSELHEIKTGKPNSFILSGRFDLDPTVYGLFGEYYFGIEAGLTPCLNVWPEETYYDYKCNGFTIDVKTSTQPTLERLFLNLPLKEIRRAHELGKPLADIFILAWLKGELSLRNVSLMGWAYKEELLKADIKEWSKKNPRFSDAHALKPSEIRKLRTLLTIIRPFRELKEQLSLW